MKDMAPSVISILWFVVFTSILTYCGDARAEKTVNFRNMAEFSFGLTLDTAATLQQHGDRRVFVQQNGDRLSNVMVQAKRRINGNAEAAAFIQLGLNVWNGTGAPSSTDNSSQGSKPLCTQADGAPCTVTPNGSQGITSNLESTLRLAVGPGKGAIQQFEPGDRMQLILGRTVTLNLVNLHLYAPASVFGLTSSLTLGDDRHGASQYRTSNGVYLWSPIVHGFYAQAGYALGQADWREGQMLMGRGGYTNGKWLNVSSVGQYSRHTGGDVASVNLGVAVVVDRFRLTAMNQWASVLNGPRLWTGYFGMLGVLVHLGPVDAFTSVAYLNAQPSESNATQVALGAIWNLVSWSALYAKTTHQYNKGSSAVQPFGTDPVSIGEDTLAAQVGWRVTM